jgi:hypothetical protein
MGYDNEGDHTNQLGIMKPLILMKPFVLSQCLTIIGTGAS